jgi:RNase P protein component
MALSADSRPHFTTIADFISTLQEEIISVFRHVYPRMWLGAEKERLEVGFSTATTAQGNATRFNKIKRVARKRNRYITNAETEC